MRRKLEAQQMLEEIDARKAWEAEQERTKKEERQQAMQLKNAQDRRLHAQRVEEATADRRTADFAQQSRMQQKESEKQAWEASEAARKDEEYVCSLTLPSTCKWPVYHRCQRTPAHARAMHLSAHRCD